MGSFYKVMLGFPSSVTPIMEGIVDLHNHIFFFLILVFVFVFWVAGNILYNFWWRISSSTKVPNINNERDALSGLRHLSHSTSLEVVWTIIPSLILVAIAIPSFALLYAMDEIMEPTLTLKVVGHQWYWTYQYSNCISQLNYSALDSPELVPASLWGRIWENGSSAYSTFFSNPVEVSRSFDSYRWSFLGIQQPEVESANPSFSVSPSLRYPTELFFQLVGGSKVASTPSSFYDLPYFSLAWFKNFLNFKVLEGLASRVTLSGVGDTLPGVKFDSYMLNEDELSKVGDYRLLEVDEPVVLPVNTHIRLLITADDVIHSFAVPQLGVKVDAVPGRLNQQGIFIKRRGVFYGQCSELCGVNHGFMPIVVKGVNSKEFVHWYLNKFNSTYPEYGLGLANPSEVSAFLEKGIVPAAYSDLFTDLPSGRLGNSKAALENSAFITDTVLSSDSPLLRSNWAALPVSAESSSGFKVKPFITKR